MKEIQLRQVDLNLLVVLDVLLRERSITRASQQLQLTPSAVSHALKRLRELFNDELLVRDGRRMHPTSRAEGLAETLPRVLQQLVRTLEEPEAFVPSTSTRTFRLSAPDFFVPLVPLLLQDVGSVAPGVRVELAPFSSKAGQALAEGRYDALIAPDIHQNEGLRGQPLGTWSWTVYGRAGHSAFTNWSLQAWAAYPHLQIGVGFNRGGGPIGRRASELGVQRVVGAVVPHFSMAAPILAQTDLLLTVPSVAMGNSVAPYQLEYRETPFDLPPMGLSLFRSASEGNEPGVRWFLERVVTASHRLAKRLKSGS